MDTRKKEADVRARVEEVVKQIEGMLSSLFAALVACVPPTHKLLYSKAASAAASNAARITVRASLDGYHKLKQVNAVQSTPGEFMAHNLLEWASWQQDSTAEAFSGEIAGHMDNPNFHACFPYFENVNAVFTGFKANNFEALNAQAKEVLEAVAVFNMLEAMRSSAFAVMLGLPNPEIWPFPHRMYAGMKRELEAVPAKLILSPIWMYPENCKPQNGG